jgi:hypothetical protein
MNSLKILESYDKFTNNIYVTLLVMEIGIAKYG